MAAEVSSVANLETYHFPFLPRLAQVLLVLPHSNADPECLFGMVRKFETEERHQLGPSTICDLLSVKLNNDKPCYSNQHLMEDSLLKSAKLATIKVYRNTEYHSACQSHYHYKGLKVSLRNISWEGECPAKPGKISLFVLPNLAIRLATLALYKIQMKTP